MSSVNENAISAFSTDEEFKSREDLMNWVQDVGRTHGYVIVTKRSKKTLSGVLYKVILKCDRGGVFKSKSKTIDQKVREINSKKINCPFELAGTYSQANDSWTLQVIRDAHNHRPTLYMEGHSHSKRLTADEASLVADLTMKNVKPRDIFSTIKKQNENNNSTNVYNEVFKVKMKMAAGRTPMQVLFHTLQDNGYSFEFQVNEESHELEELFFIHPVSMKIWRVFPHVLFIDATYKTNKYNMPFLQIIGVTSTHLSFCIAYVFMLKEKECNYTWALECLRSNMDESVFPRVILTDRELALMNACERIFSEAKQLLCRWHISQAIVRKCRSRFRSLEEWKYFTAKWDSFCESSNWETYLHRYARLEALLVEREAVLNYLNDVWINKYKELFVSYWTDKVLNFKNHTTNRAESQHALLKLHLGSARSNLDRFIHFINQIVELQHSTIKESLERSRIKINPKHNTYMFQHLLGFVSKNAIELIHKELTRSNGLEITFQNCGCILRTSCGLPCACELATLYSGRYIPIESIGIFWRKLDLLPSTSMQDDDLTCDVELEQLKQTFQKQSKFGKGNILRKIRGLFDATTSFITEPAVQKKTRGRPKNADKQQKTNNTKPSKAVPQNRQPQYNSYMDPGPPMYNSYMGSESQTQPQPQRYSYFNDYKFDLNHSPSRYSSYVDPEPSRHSSYMNYEQALYSSYVDPGPPMYNFSEPPMYNFLEPPTYNSYVESEPPMNLDPLIKAISKNYQPYVRHVQNVMGDGNCGFRVVAVWLGLDESCWPHIRRDLLNEIEAHKSDYENLFGEGHLDVLKDSINFFDSCGAPYTKWMIISDTAAVIASCYNVIVHFISERENITWLPLWTSPPENPQNVTWVIGLVHGNHFVKVDLHKNYPLPLIYPSWYRYKWDCATAWENLYLNRV